MASGRGARGLQVTVGLRGAAAGLTAAAGALLWVLRRSSPEVSARRRILRRLDLVAPKVLYDPELERTGGLLNGECPVCLVEFRRAGAERVLRMLECRHALCAGCLEGWVVHCVKTHLNPNRFGVTRGGAIFAWAPGPSCPLCKAAVNAVPHEDLRSAIVSAMLMRGSALSRFVASADARARDPDD